MLREVEIECLPADIPSHIDVDVSGLEMHQVLRVSGLPHSDKIKYLNAEDATVAHVVSIREEVAAAAEAEACGWLRRRGCTGRTGSGQEGQDRRDAAKKPEAGAKK